MQSRILATECYGHMLCRIFQLFEHLIPVFKLRLPVFDIKRPADLFRKILFLKDYRHFIEIFLVEVIEDTFPRHIAEKSYLIPCIIVQRIFRAAYYHIRMKPQSLKLPHGGLGRLGLHLLGSLEIGDKGHMDQYGITRPDLILKLPYGLQEGLAFYITHGTSDLDYCYMDLIIRGIAVESALDLIGDMRYHLHSASAIVAAPFFI